MQFLAKPGRWAHGMAELSWNFSFLSGIAAVSGWCLRDPKLPFALNHPASTPT